MFKKWYWILLGRFNQLSIDVADRLSEQSEKIRLLEWAQEAFWEPRFNTHRKMITGVQLQIHELKEEQDDVDTDLDDLRRRFESLEQRQKAFESALLFAFVQIRDDVSGEIASPGEFITAHIRTHIREYESIKHQEDTDELTDVLKSMINLLGGWPFGGIRGLYEGEAFGVASSLGGGGLEKRKGSNDLSAGMRQTGKSDPGRNAHAEDCGCWMCDHLREASAN